ncbi:MAG: HEPN domain-containing protein [Candidatus Hydrogenedentes bacterium]|nr:HEPN domain-containing protein [Candidatus Hydrogenedentota bacterium]
MQHDGSSYPEDFLRIAKRDLERVSQLLHARDPAAAGFYLQQTVEKHLKAFLLRNGWKLKRIHDLETLLEAAMEYDGAFETYRSACQTISALYMAERYPTLTIYAPDEEDVRELLKSERGLLEALSARAEGSGD